MIADLGLLAFADTLSEIFSFENICMYFYSGVILLTPFMIPYLLFMYERKPSGGVAGFAIAILLLLPYGYGDYAMKKLALKDLPPEYCISEAFMFHVEKTGGIKNFYAGGQDYHTSKPGVGKKDIYDIVRRWKYVLPGSSADGNFWFFFRKGRESAMFPLSVEIKMPGDAFESGENIDTKKARYSFSRWNENLRVDIDRYGWSRHIKPAVGKYTLSFMCDLAIATALIFVVAALAYKVRRNWLFFGMWGLVFALYVLNIYDTRRYVPGRQYVRCAPESAVAAVSAPEHRELLQKLLHSDTSAVEPDPRRTVIAAPLLIGGDFFTVRFLCWDLGCSNYLYYSPADLVKAGIVTDVGKVARVGDNLLLVSYPDLAKSVNRLWMQFVLVQTTAGVLWILLFAWMLRQRRKLAAATAK